MSKDLLKQRFYKSLKTYNNNAIVQKHMAEKLLTYLDRKDFDNILEIGCGTGFLTALAQNSLEYKKYTANDIVEECGEIVKNINPEINFISGDYEIETLKGSESYDLIISNASFQWVNNFEIFINRLIGKLNSNGILLFSTFGKENFKEIYKVQGKSLNYYSKQNLEDMFREYNPFIEEEIRVLSFKTPLEVLRHLHFTGVNSLESVSWTKSDMLKFEKNYLSISKPLPTLTYNPIYVKIVHNK